MVCLFWQQRRTRLFCQLRTTTAAASRRPVQPRSPARSHLPHHCQQQSAVRTVHIPVCPDSTSLDLTFARCGRHTHYTSICAQHVVADNPTIDPIITYNQLYKQCSFFVRIEHTTAIEHASRQPRPTCRLNIRIRNSHPPRLHPTTAFETTRLRNRLLFDTHCRHCPTAVAQTAPQCPADTALRAAMRQATKASAV